MDTVVYTVKNRVATIRIAREEKLNAITADMYAEILRLMKQAEADDDVGAIILTGTGTKAFSAGTDITKMGSKGQVEANGVTRPKTKADRLVGGKKIQETMKGIEHLKKPVIAAMNGLAAGGGFELALSCDIRIASDTAFFFFPEVSYGIMPGSGGSQRLTRISGIAVCKYMSFTCERVYAEKAKEFGIVTEVLPSDKLMPRAIEMAERIASYPASGLALCKDAIYRGAQVPLEEGLYIEERNFVDCYDYPAAFAGIDKFNNRKK